MPQRFGSNGAGGMAAGAVCGELVLSFGVQNRLRHDGSCRVSGAEKQNVVVRHSISRLPVDLSCSRLGRSTAFVDVLGFAARDEGAHELLVHRAGERLDVETLGGEEFPGIFDAVNSRRFDFDLLEAGAR